jgi:hypothetical protein
MNQISHACTTKKGIKDYLQAGNLLLLFGRGYSRYALLIEGLELFLEFAVVLWLVFHPVSVRIARDGDLIGTFIVISGRTEFGYQYTGDVFF